MLLECEGDACAAALKAPKAGSGALLEEFTVEELPKPENPEDPKLLVGSEESLNEKEAAEGADGLPKAGGWETLVEDIAPNAGGLQPAEELPKAGAFPDEAPKRLELVLKEKLLALVLLLFTGKLDAPKLDVCCPPNPNEGDGCMTVFFNSVSNATFVVAFKVFNCSSLSFQPFTNCWTEFK